MTKAKTKIIPRETIVSYSGKNWLVIKQNGDLITMQGIKGRMKEVAMVVPLNMLKVLDKPMIRVIKK